MGGFTLHDTSFVRVLSDGGRSMRERKKEVVALKGKKTSTRVTLVVLLLLS
jgi:hypothetical protein